MRKRYDVDAGNLKLDKRLAFPDVVDIKIFEIIITDPQKLIIFKPVKKSN